LIIHVSQRVHKKKELIFHGTAFSVRKRMLAVNSGQKKQKELKDMINMNLWGLIVATGDLYGKVINVDGNM